MTESIQVHRMFPIDPNQGRYMESCAIFAAKRCRTRKNHADLWAEVVQMTDEKREQYLTKVVTQDWASDVLEIPYLIFDWEKVPVWLITELFRHRHIIRDWSPEQMSQRAIKIVDVDCHESMKPALMKYLEALEAADLKSEDYREALPQGALTNLVIAGNVRAFREFFLMRSSEGHGGAHKKFEKLADESLALAREVYPISLISLRNGGKE